MVTFELKNDSIENEQMYTIHILSSLCFHSSVNQIDQL